MKLLLTAAVPAMALTHMEWLGNARYLPIMGILLLLYATTRKVHVVDAWWYSVGGVLIFAGMALSAVVNGNGFSFVYLLFAPLVYFFYPLLARYTVDDRMVAAVLLFLLLTLVPLGFGTRVKSLYVNSNNYSAIVLCTLYFGMLLFRNRPAWQLGALGLFLGLAVIGESRTIVGGVVMFALLYYGRRMVGRQFRAGLIVGFFLLVAGYVTLVTDDRFALLTAIQENELSDKNERGLSHRDELFWASTGIIRDFPEGVGLGRSNYWIQQRFGQYLSPHNTYLKVLVEGGWLMFAGFLLVMLGYLATTRSYLASSFIFVMLFRGLFESSTPFTLSLISAMLIVPMFLDENSIVAHRLTLRPTKP